METMFLVFLSWQCVFFTVGTGGRFAGGFGAVDVFLEFFLKGVMEKLSSFGEEECFHVIEGLSVGGVGSDEVAFVEQGIEAGVEEVTNIGRFGRHKIRPCKSVYFPILTTPTKLGHTP